MENNIVKDNYLEIVKDRELVNTIEPNVLPMIIEDRAALLPMIIPDFKTIVEVKKEQIELEESIEISKLLKFAKGFAKFVAKTVRFSFISLSNVALLAGVSAVIVTSIAIITKNAVNSYYNIEQPDDSTYTVFEVKDK